MRLRAAERLLHRCESRLRSVPEEGEVGIAHIGIDGRFLTVTERFCAIVGHSEQALLGERLEDITHPADLGPDVQHFRRMISGEVDGCVLEQRFIRRDGEVAFGRMSVTLLRCIQGRPMYQVAVLVDLTRQERLRRICEQARADFDRQSGLLDAQLNQVTAGVTVIDTRSGTIVYSNLRAAQMLGLPPRSGAGRLDYPLILEAIRARRSDGTVYPADGEPLASAIGAGELVLGETLLIQSRIGEPMELTLSSAPILDRKRRVVLAIVVLQSYADGVRLSDTIRRLKVEAELMSQEKSQFLALMSHGMRLPITSIDGYCELLLLGTPEPIGEQAREQVRRIQEAGRHLLDLIDDVLLFARLESGISMELATRNIDVAATIGELARIYDPLAELGRVKVHTELPDRAVVARTDDRRFRTVVAGLVSNGVRLAEAGDVHIRLNDCGETLDLKIECAGPHITPEAVEKLSHPTWTALPQLPDAKLVAPTVGLGMVRPLASALGGSLEISSGRGAVSFILHLPTRTGEIEVHDPVPHPP